MDKIEKWPVNAILGKIASQIRNGAINIADDSILYYDDYVACLFDDMAENVVIMYLTRRHRVRANLTVIIVLDY
jgi:hypothetical protein